MSCPNQGHSLALSGAFFRYEPSLNTSEVHARPGCPFVRVYWPLSDERGTPVIVAPERVNTCDSKHGLSTEPVPLSAYAGSSKKLKELKVVQSQTVQAQLSFLEVCLYKANL